MNYLKKIEIYGFKSFGKKAEISFDDHITAVVGPNGSGKSNIVDAVRWVLGEQRVKSLRGGSMEDVIFSGSNEKKPLGYAQVTLVIDNHEKILPIDYDEVSVSRRYFRSGESEYYINKGQCRLRDIHELFMDTGLSREGYSIIGQGKIESIVNNTPFERKLMIEEAVGIVKYKARKTEAERKLEKAQNNLYRITDLIAEIEKRLPSLKRQSEKAKKYLELKSELKGIEVNIFVHRMDRLSEQREKSLFDKETIENSLHQLDSDIGLLNNRYEKLQGLLETYETKVRESSEKLIHLRDQYENSKTEIEVCKNKVENYVSAITANEGKIEELTVQTGQLETQLKELSEEMQILQAKQQSLMQQAEEKTKISDQLKEKVNESGAYIQHLKAQRLDKQQKQQSLQKQLNEIKSKSDSGVYIREMLEEEQGKLLKKLESLKESDVNTVYRQLQQQQEILLQEKTQLNVSYVQTREKQQKHQQNTNELLGEIRTTESKLEMLKGYDYEKTAYRFGVRKLLEAKSRDNILKEGLLGAVGDLIKVDGKYTQAIQKALGGALEYIVVTNEQVAKRGITLLKQNNWGRVTFLPHNIVKSHRYHGLGVAVTENKGYVGIASELVSCETRFKNVIENLLGRVLVFNTLDDASEVARQTKHQYKIVTLDGEILFPGGAMVGGKSKGDENGILSVKAQTVQLEKVLVTKKELYEQILQVQQKVTQQMEELSQKLEENRNHLDTIQAQLTKEEAQSQQTAAVIAEVQQQIADNKQEVSQSAKQEEQADQLVKQLEQELELSNEQLMQLDNEIEKIASGAYKDAYLVAVEEKNKADIQLLSIQEKINRLFQQEQYLQEQLLNAKKELADRNHQIENAKEDIDSLTQQISHYQEIDRDYDYVKEDMEKTYSECVVKRDRANKEFREVNDKSILYRNEKAAVMERLSKIELNLNKTEMQMEHLQQEILEDYNLTYTAAIPYKESINDLEGAIHHVQELKNAVAKLGHVNVDALEEYKEVKERFDFLTKEKEDLTGAKENLNEIIADISKTMQQQFLSQFEQIQEQFGKAFKKLFNGGEARLILTSPDDVMEGGVDIVAQPPNTKLKNISSLSGGEKSMTAIALIFAILKIKPSPFCILDEIDAALDDANVARISEYLYSIRKNNQFVIITHRKKTMEIADVLYGASMGHDGITQLISVKLSDVGQEGELNG